ncbi:MAG: hypothetical protein FWE25_10350 [Lachnospiraceae bacterium]|nr:hypothetical protein [Lachnospiraceae bacterium]
MRCQSENQEAYVFHSHSGFTRAFINGFGISPKKFSAQPEPKGWMIAYAYLNRSKKPNDKKMEEKKMKEIATVFTQIMERPARKLILMRGKAATDYFTYIYAQGLEVAADYQGAIPKGFDVIDLAPCKYLVFQGEPYDDENFMEAIESCMESIQKFSPEVYGFAYAPEIAPKIQLKPWGWRGYIEMYPVKAI